MKSKGLVFYLTIVMDVVFQRHSQFTYFCPLQHSFHEPRITHESESILLLRLPLGPLPVPPVREGDDDDGGRRERERVGAGSAGNGTRRSRPSRRRGAVTLYHGPGLLPGCPTNSPGTPALPKRSKSLWDEG